MADLRVTVVFDFTVDADDVDLDEFHDDVRNQLESAEVTDLICSGYPWTLDSVREIDVRELTE